MKGFIGMTPEKFNSGLEDFIRSQPIKTGFIPLDNLVSKGIPVDKISFMTGESNLGCYHYQYLESLISSGKIVVVDLEKIIANLKRM